MTMLERFVNKFKKEGVDHIRIHPHAETILGRAVSKDWRHRFFIPHVGEFTSPVCFANWLCTGDDEARHDPKFRFATTVKGYQQFVLYGKFYQLCAMRNLLKREMKDLPFVSYKLHQSGVKEFDRWKDYPAEIKEMIEHVLDPQRGPKKPYDWSAYPGIEERVKEMISEIVGPIEESEEPQPPRSKKKAAAQQAEQVTEPTAEETAQSSEVQQTHDTADNQETQQVPQEVVSQETPAEEKVEA